MKVINKLDVNVSNNLECKTTPKKKPILCFLSHQKIKSINNSSINLHPKGIGKGYEKYQAFSKEAIGEISATMGYISNFRNSGEEAIVIHGTQSGRVALYSHLVENRKEFTVKDFISHIKKVQNIDIGKNDNGPLHVMSCFGVSNGVYQAFSDELNREVIGYGDGNAISINHNLKNYFNKETANIKSVIGDVEKDRPEDLQLTEASIHKYIPHTSTTKTSG